MPFLLLIILLHSLMQNILLILLLLGKLELKFSMSPRLRLIIVSTKCKAGSLIGHVVENSRLAAPSNRNF